MTHFSLLQNVDCQVWSNVTAHSFDSQMPVPNIQPLSNSCLSREYFPFKICKEISGKVWFIYAPFCSVKICLCKGIPEIYRAATGMRDYDSPINSNRFPYRCSMFSVPLRVSPSWFIAFHKARDHIEFLGTIKRDKLSYIQVGRCRGSFISAFILCLSFYRLPSVLAVLHGSIIKNWK